MSYAAVKHLSRRDSETRVVFLPQGGSSNQRLLPREQPETHREIRVLPQRRFKTNDSGDRTRFWINAGSSGDTEERPTQRVLLGQPHLPVALKRAARRHARSWRSASEHPSRGHSRAKDAWARGEPQSQSSSKPDPGAPALSQALSSHRGLEPTNKSRAASLQSCPRASGHGHAILLTAPIVL